MHSLPSVPDALDTLTAHAAVPAPASVILLAVAAVVATSLQPPPRGQATAATLAEIAALPEVAGLPLTSLQARDAFLALTEPHADDTPPIVARRRTCGEIAAALPARPDAPGPVAPQAEAVWSAVAAHFPGEDARAAAVRATWGREASELGAAFVAERIAAAASYIAEHPERCDVRVNGGGRYLLEVWSWSDDELRAMGLDAVREIRRFGGVDLPEPLSLRLRAAYIDGQARCVRVTAESFPGRRVAAKPPRSPSGACA